MKFSYGISQLIVYAMLTGCVGGGQGSLFQPGSSTDTSGNFQGCVTGDPIDSSRIRVNFSWPADASEMDIYRNGSLVATFTDESVTSFIDLNLQEGGSYQYRCDAKINGILKQGSNVLNLSPINVNAPIFSGIFSATPKLNDPDNDSITVSWNPASSSGPLVSYYKIYAKPGCSMIGADFQAPPKIISTLGNLSVDIDGIGDEIPFSFAVRACTSNDICDENLNVKYITPVCSDSGLPDTGAPKNLKAIARLF